MWRGGGGGGGVSGLGFRVCFEWWVVCSCDMVIYFCMCGVVYGTCA